MTKKAAAPQTIEPEPPPVAAPSSAAAPTVTFVENLHAPELFASEAVGFFLHGGVVTITLSSTQIDHRATPGPLSRVVVGRVVLPVQGAQGLAAGLYDFLKKMGADPVPRDEKQSLQ